MSSHQKPREGATNGERQGGPVPTSHGRHGGNQGADQQRNQDAKGSSRRGDEPNADSRNTGGGHDTESSRRTQPVHEKDGAYPNAGQHPSAANDGGTITDPSNR